MFQTFSSHQRPSACLYLMYSSATYWLTWTNVLGLLSGGNFIENKRFFTCGTSQKHKWKIAGLLYSKRLDSFLGNEFGHPDWVEFTSANNKNDIYRARRLFQLADDDNLRYKYLSRFDAAMNKAEEKYGWLRAGPVGWFRHRVRYNSNDIEIR